MFHTFCLPQSKIFVHCSLFIVIIVFAVLYGPYAIVFVGKRQSGPIELNDADALTKQYNTVLLLIF